MYGIGRPTNEGSQSANLLYKAQNPSRFIIHPVKHPPLWLSCGLFNIYAMYAQSFFCPYFPAAGKYTTSWLPMPPAACMLVNEVYLAELARWVGGTKAPAI